MYKLRDNYKKKAQKTGLETDKQTAKRVRNNVTQFSRTLKKTYFLATFDEAGNDSKKLWKILKQLFGNYRKKNEINEINGRYDQTEIADEINNFFADIGPNLANDIPDFLIELVCFSRRLRLV